MIHHERAIEFWDNYHTQQQYEDQQQITPISSDIRPSPEFSTGIGSSNSSISTATNHGAETEGGSIARRSKEWILRDSPLLLKSIHSVLNSIATFTGSSTTEIKRAPIIENQQHILEIGCGTSRLSRSVLEYVRSIDNTKQSSSPLSYHIIASDVSEVCLRMNRIRDRNFPSLLNQQQQTQNNQQNDRDSANKTTLKDTLKYIALDITKDNCEFNHHYNESTSTDCVRTIELPKLHDMVLDKGCLDTLLFRRSTCHEHNSTHSHSPLVTNLLNNVHSILKPNGGVYFLITPRSKLKSVRDFSGFRSVTIEQLSHDKGDTKIEQDNNPGIEMGDLELTHTNMHRNTPESQQCAYIYTCIRNDRYQIEKHSPYIDKYGIAKLPLDDDICLKCGISFIKFRSGENVQGRGRAFWSRRWRGHGLHCTG